MVSAGQRCKFMMQYLIYSYSQILPKRPVDQPELSAELKNLPAKPATRRWLEAMVDSSALLGAILSVMHPQLFRAGMDTLRKLESDPGLVKDGEQLIEVLKLWTSPFSGYSIIHNRETPLHRDINTQAVAYDLLVSVGPYIGAIMNLPTLGVTLDYPSGTCVAFSGKVIRHGVKPEVGSRLCIAHYMRDNVHERAGTRPWTSMNVAQYDGIKY